LLTPFFYAKQTTTSASSRLAKLLPSFISNENIRRLYLDRYLTNATTPQNALRRLVDKNIVTRIDCGNYQFEDKAFADWVRHRK
jgi:hypothetical protein